MNILHINSYYAIGSFYKNLFQKQIDTGHHLQVYIPAIKQFNDNNRDFGDYSTISPILDKFDRFFFKRKQRLLLSDLTQKIKIDDIDLVHSHSLFTNGYLALNIKKRYGIPYLAAIRNTDVNIFFKYMIHLRKYGIEVMNQASYLIFLSPKYRDFIIKKYIPEKSKQTHMKKSIIIPNGIDEFWFKNKNQKKRKPKEKEINLLFVGNIDKNKNVLTTLKAIGILQKKGYQIKFTIVGKILDQSIYKKIQKNSCVSHKNYSPKEKLLEIYKKNDIFIMPSKTETFGRVYPEAMSQGLPVIYSKGQGFDGQFPEGTVGYHVNSSEPEDIAEKIECILKNYEQISENCIEKAERFTWDPISEEYNDLYLKIKNQKGEKIDG